MEYLFKKEICDWNTWGQFFQSIEDFRELIKAILVKEGLTGDDQISKLNPGTNAVFKVGDYVIKIFAPKESGANTDGDYNAEIQAMRRAIDAGITTPNVMAASYIQDKYLFRYIIMDYIEGQEAGSKLKQYSYEQKINFVNRLKDNLQKINSSPKTKLDGASIVNRALNNKRWNKFDKKIKKQISDILMSANLSRAVNVHGDITADNVLVDEKDNIFIIDFADSTEAPLCYEYPPIIFDLFDFDKELIVEFIKDMTYEDFIDNLFIGTLLHEFGAYFVELIYKKYMMKDISELSDICDIKSVLNNFIGGEFK